MLTKQLLSTLPAGLLILGTGAAIAGQTISEVGALACVNDKWDEKELEKGHKLVDYAGRCIRIPDDPAEPKDTADCIGKYEYMPDESWKGSGTCTGAQPNGREGPSPEGTTASQERCSKLIIYPKSSACCIAALQAGDLKSEQNACSRSLRFVEIRNFWEIMQ
jgi:hypothetical protein